MPKRDYTVSIQGIGMFAGIRNIGAGMWRVAFAAGAGAAVLLICLAACLFTLAAAAPRLRHKLQ